MCVSLYTSCDILYLQQYGEEYNIIYRNIIIYIDFIGSGENLITGISIKNQNKKFTFYFFYMIRAKYVAKVESRSSEIPETSGNIVQSDRAQEQFLIFLKP